MNYACSYSGSTHRSTPFNEASNAILYSSHRFQIGVKKFVQSFIPTIADSRWEMIFDEIRELASLLSQIEPGDDIPPDEATVELAVSVAKSLQQKGWDSPGSVYPGVSCSVIMEWRYGKDIREIEVFNDRHAIETWCFGDGRSPTIEPFRIQDQLDYK